MRETQVNFSLERGNIRVEFKISPGGSWSVFLKPFRGALEDRGSQFENLLLVIKWNFDMKCVIRKKLELRYIL